MRAKMCECLWSWLGGKRKLQGLKGQSLLCLLYPFLYCSVCVCAVIYRNTQSINLFFCSQTCWRKWKYTREKDSERDWWVMRERVKGPDSQVSFFRLPSPSSLTPSPSFSSFCHSTFSPYCRWAPGWTQVVSLLLAGGCGGKSCRSAGLEPHAGTARLCKST